MVILKDLKPEDINAIFDKYLFEIKIQKKPPTISGISLLLNIPTKLLKTLFDEGENLFLSEDIPNTKQQTTSSLFHIPTTHHTIAKENLFSLVMNKQKIVDYVETLLINSDKTPTGLVFWLKNRDNWVDRQVHDVNKKDETMFDLLEQIQTNKKIDSANSNIK